jgi:hypothetical protein
VTLSSNNIVDLTVESSAMAETYQQRASDGAPLGTYAVGSPMAMCFDGANYLSISPAALFYTMQN